jgi:hypothetical protein
MGAHQYKRFFGLQARGNTTTFDAFGILLAAFVPTGTTANADNTVCPFISVQNTVATTGQVASAATLAAYVRRDWEAQLLCHVALGATITTQRFWCGLASGSPSGSDTPAVHLAAFRGSTGAGDTNFQCVTDNGSGTPTITDSGVAIAANGDYIFEIVTSSDNADVLFYINHVLVATHTTLLPGATTYLFGGIFLTVLDNVNRMFLLDKMVFSMEG